MRRFIILSLFTLAISAPIRACGGEGVNHNYYLFSVFRHELMSMSLFEDRINAFWDSYTNGKTDAYRWNEKLIMDVAKKKGDQEMISYLNQLNTYIAISDQLQETWKYPTKQELQQRRQNLNRMIALAKAYKGTKLKAQWKLLNMRANMVLGQHAANIAFWDTQASKLPASVYRDMMRNIYAGALLHEGRRTEACDIYAEQGDMVSIKWAMRKIRNLGGIKTIYEEAPDSPTMSFLIQDFVNNAQETIDSDGDKEYVEEFLDHRVILKHEVDNFISYANNLVKNGKVKSPALWLAAIGELHYLYGNNDEGMKALNKAVDMNGTKRMKDNARAIRAVVCVKNATLDKEYSQWMTNEIKWLVSMVHDENATNPEGATENPYHNHYSDVLDRLVYKELIPKYEKSGRPDMAAALLAMMESGKLTKEEAGNETPEYWNEYFNYIDKMTAEELIRYCQFLQKSTDDPFEQYVKSFVKYPKDYMNDLIGTKYLANGEFEKALPYLNQVPLSFLESQNISYYHSHRDYTKARWFVRQKDNEKESYTDGPNLGTITVNKKAAFCRDMIQLEEQYSIANAQARQEIAYNMAVRYFQASFLGECWWLTNYGNSVAEEARKDRPDFVETAIKYLNESKASTNSTLSLNSLYALAYIPYGPWCDIDYNWENNTTIYKPLRQARQYKALYELNQFVKKSGSQPEFIQKCDVLKTFRKYI